MDFFKDLLTFLWAVIDSWAGYTTGGIIVAILWLWSILRQRAVPRKIAVAVAVFFVFCAVFHAWREQFHKASNVQAKFDASTKPEFRVVIAQIIGTYSSSGKTVFLVQMGVFNRGADSVLANISAHYQSPTLNSDVDVVYMPPEEEVRAFPEEWRTEDRPVPNMQSVGMISRGALVPGKLFVTVPGNHEAELGELPSALTITVRDYLGSTATGWITPEGNGADMRSALPFHQSCGTCKR
jgi:hypothetical protein